MKGARIIVIGVAVVAGGAAALLSQRADSPPPAPVAVQQQPAVQPSIDTVEVLTAAAPIPMGSVIQNQHLKWQLWPRTSAENFIRREGAAAEMSNYVGALARQPFVAGEPINEGKIIKTGSAGFMSAILPPGMRAISTEISAETGAGGFILPNDRVDVILTRREPGANGGREEYVSSTILTNVRVLAIDQTLDDKNGQRVVVGRTATLELMPRQAEVLALARQLGTISMTLRSVSDANPDGLEGEALPQMGASIAGGRPGDGGRMTIVRYGIATQVAQ